MRFAVGCMHQRRVLHGSATAQRHRRAPHSGLPPLRCTPRGDPLPHSAVTPRRRRACLQLPSGSASPSTRPANAPMLAGPDTHHGRAPVPAAGPREDRGGAARRLKEAPGAGAPGALARPARNGRSDLPSSGLTHDEVPLGLCRAERGRSLPGIAEERLRLLAGGWRQGVFLAELTCWCMFSCLVNVCAHLPRGARCQQHGDLSWTSQRGAPPVAVRLSCDVGNTTILLTRRHAPPSLARAWGGAPGSWRRAARDSSAQPCTCEASPTPGREH